MKNTLINLHFPVRLSIRLTFVIAFILSAELSAQQKLTSKLINGKYQQYPIDGLKLTFDNNGTFSCWQNKQKHEMAFDSIRLIYFTDQSMLNRINISISDSKELNVFPNPSTGLITLEFNQYSGENCEVSVSNLIGTEVFRMNLTGNMSQIDLSNQANGVYFLKIVLDDKLFTKRIILR
jgi:hypothetical protein